MSVLETEKQESAALSAKLEGARAELSMANKELNTLRNRVVKLEDASEADDLRSSNVALKASLADAQAALSNTSKELAKAIRDLDAAGPALALAAAIEGLRA